MPAVSEAQERLMEAAAHTSGGYGGVPQKVGKEFIGKDMATSKWATLKRLFVEWINEEEGEPEHRAQDESAEEKARNEGKLTERERESAGRVGSEHREDEPEGVFLDPGERKYPVKTEQDGDWKYDSRLLLAAAREARMHGHEDLAKRADEIRGREFGAASDMALDRDTVREKDADGRLHVSRSNISKAAINEYLGREIPEADTLGLDPGKKYRLLRDPGELKKAVASFNNLPILSEHVPVSAAEPRPDLVIGSTGTDAKFDAPYLTNSLAFWPQRSIDDIENGGRKELSCAYRYRADMTPGTHEGEPYDGVMRDIVGNHVALVAQGRAGPDVVVGDEAIAEEQDMKSKAAQTRKAALAALRTKITVKMAQDADIQDVTKLLDALEGEDDLDPNSAIPAEDAETDEEREERLKRRAEDRAAGRDAAKDEDPETEEEKKRRMEARDRKARDAAEPPDFGGKPEPGKKPEPITEKAMDAAIQSAVAAERGRQKELRAAETFVRPWVGDMAMDGIDTAADVYRKALGILGVTDAATIHPSALQAVLRVQRQPGARQAKTAVAMDAAAAKGFDERFPSAAHIHLT